MITLKELNKLPIKTQMALCNFIAISNNLKSYTIQSISKYINQPICIN